MGRGPFIAGSVKLFLDPASRKGTSSHHVACTTLTQAQHTTSSPSVGVAANQADFSINTQALLWWLFTLEC